MGILLNYFSHKKFRYHQRKVILFYILKILLFVLVRYKNLMKRAKKKYPTSCRHAKKCFPLHIVE